MTLAMLLVLINHHKGLTILLIVIIALLVMALTPLVKNCLAPFTIGPDFFSRPPTGGHLSSC